MSNQNEKKWVCEYCTFENFPSTLKCTLCRGIKQPEVIGKDDNNSQDETAHLTSQDSLNNFNKDPYNKWNCGECTFLNWPRAAKCTQCQVPRKSSPSGSMASLIMQDASQRTVTIEKTGLSLKQSSPIAFDKLNIRKEEICEQDKSRVMQKWSCGLCTYDNWPKAAKCVMCESPRGFRVSGSSDRINESIKLSDINEKSAVTDENFYRTSGVEKETLVVSPRRVVTTELQRTSPVLCSSSDIISPPSLKLPEVTDVQVQASLAETASGTVTTNNYEHERMLRKIRKCVREADWRWLHACLGIVDGDASPVEAYLSSGGDPTRQLTSQEVNLLNRSSAFDPGHTLIHLAVRFHREDVLALLLEATEVTGAGRKRVPSHIAPDLAAEIRRHVSTSFRQRKGDFMAYFVTECTTFALPAEIEEFPAHVQEQLFDELLDRDVQKELEVEAPIINWSLELTDRLGSRLYALWNRTAGDCLLDSVLQATYGVFDKDNTLRRLLADSLCEAASTFYPRWHESESLQAQLLHFSLDEYQWQQDWAELLSLASQPGASLEQLHVFALAHILRRPIIVYAVKLVKSFRGETLGYARFEGVYLPLLWEKSFCWRSPIALGYTRGHFSALVPMEPDTNDTLGAGANIRSQDDLRIVFLPLMSSDGKVLPVHFLTASEIGHEERILREWLDCCVTEGGIFVAQQHISKRPLLVAQMVEEWLNHYRRLCHVVSPHQLPIHRSPVPHGQGYSSDGDSDDDCTLPTLNKQIIRFT